MNTITVLILVVFCIALITLTINSLVLTCRWASMKKGRKPKQAFIEKGHRIVLWASLTIAYLAMFLFCIFYDTDPVTKAKLCVIILLIPLHPLALILIVDYCYLFRQNREYSNMELSTRECSE